MLKFFIDLKEKKTNEIQEVLEQMQEMRQRRIVEIWRALGDMPQAIRTAETRLQEGQGNLLLKEKEILNGLSSNEQLASWVGDRKQCSNSMLQRALERAMRRAFAEKWEKWDWDEWEGNRNKRWREAESMRKEEWEKWKWGYVKWLMETNKMPGKEEEEMAQERRATNKEWEQERKRRERER